MVSDVHKCDSATRCQHCNGITMSIVTAEVSSEGARGPCIFMYSAGL